MTGTQENRQPIGGTLMQLPWDLKEGKMRSKQLRIRVNFFIAVQLRRRIQKKDNVRYKGCRISAGGSAEVE
jgi:hypothetical protein